MRVGRRGRVWLAMVLAFAAGLAGPALAGRWWPAGGGPAAQRVVGDAPDERAAVPVRRPSGAPMRVVAPEQATEPVGALAAFLALEVAGDFRGSHAYLTPQVRHEHRSAAGWEAAHAQMLPIEGFRVTDAGPDDGAPVAWLVTDLTLRSSLDPVLGLVPARATARWRLVEVDGLWRVDFTSTEVRAVWPDDDDAVAAARSWLAGGCGAPSAVLLGAVASAASACAATTPPDLGPARPLDPAAAPSDLVAAHGPESVTWARWITVRGGTDVDLLMAPVDDGWSVIGVYPSGGAS